MPEEARRRRYEHVNAHLPVRISTIEPETDPWTGKPFFRSSCEWSGNVSRGGVFVHTREPIRPGSRVLVELDLPGGTAVEALGRVAWTASMVRPTSSGSMRRRVTSTSGSSGTAA